MSFPCFYSVSAINYKNQYCSVCPRQSDRLSYEYLPSKIFNDVGFVDIRNKLLEGIWPKGCGLCEEMENESNNSMRFDHPYPENDFLINGLVHNNGLKHVEFRFNNACNMSCLHCSSVFSSEWEKKIKSYEPNEIDYLYDLRQLLNTEHKIDSDENLKIKLTPSMIREICDDLNSNFKNLSHIDVTGGEPLFQKHFFVFLESIIKHPNIRNIKLKFHTNFNVNFDSKQLYDYFKNFKQVIMTISVDSGKNIYSYFRDGDWNRLEENILKFREVDNETIIYATCTTSAFQLLDIFNVFKSLLTLNVDGFKSSIVQTPRYINPRVLKYEFEKEILDQIEKTFKLNLTKNSYSSLQTIKKYFVNGSYDVKNYMAFLHYIDKTQKLFKKNFNDHYTMFKYENGELHLNET